MATAYEYTVTSVAPDQITRSGYKRLFEFSSLLPVLQKQRLRFLTDDEFGSLADQLENGRSDTIIANELLVILDRDCPETARKFIACLLEEKEHRAEAIGMLRNS